MPSYDNPRDRPPELAHRVVSQPILERSASSTLLEDQSMSKWNKNQGPGNVGDGSGQDVPHDTEAGVIDGENVPVHQNNGKQSYASITSNLGAATSGAKDHRARASLPKGLMSVVAKGPKLKKII
ncbi:hypothetical protein V6N13_053696 [Hibiscus sabdariffa]